MPNNSKLLQLATKQSVTWFVCNSPKNQNVVKWLAYHIKAPQCRHECLMAEIAVVLAVNWPSWMSSIQTSFDIYIPEKPRNHVALMPDECSHQNSLGHGAALGSLPPLCLTQIKEVKLENYQILLV